MQIRSYQQGVSNKANDNWPVVLRAHAAKGVHLSLNAAILPCGQNPVRGDMFIEMASRPRFFVFQHPSAPGIARSQTQKFWPERCPAPMGAEKQKELMTGLLYL